MSLLFATNLDVSLGGKKILTQLNFSIVEGSWTGVLGPNGSGKTTLLRTLSGLVDYEGDLKLADRQVRDWSSRDLACQLAFVRQSHSMTFDFRVEDLVLLGRSPHKSILSTYDNNDAQQVEQALNLVDLSGFKDRSFHSLSGGEQQRVFLAQSLVQEADILVLDEPTTHLDVHHQYEFMQHVRTLVDRGKTVIGAFHDLELAARFSDELLILDDGQISATGTPQEVLNADLLAKVFRMQAEVVLTHGQNVRIHYAKPLS